MTAQERDHSLKSRIIAAMSDRTMEWYSSFVMVGWGWLLSRPEPVLTGPAYDPFFRYAMTEDRWAIVFLVIGSVRLVALYINGRWPRTPLIRIIGAGFGFATWLQVALMVTEGSMQIRGVPGTGTVAYGLLALFELVAVYRAGFDARYHRR